MPKGKPTSGYRVIRNYRPDPARQVQALLLLLGQPSPETRQPQELSPGAMDCGTVDGGHNLWSELTDDTIHEKPRT
jgi:hypothetical protein